MHNVSRRQSLHRNRLIHIGGKRRFRPRQCSAPLYEPLEQRTLLAVTAFGQPVNYTFTDAADFTTLADFNGDGNLDMVISSYAGSMLSLRLGSSNGTFGAASNIPLTVRPDYVGVADLNRDGKIDLIATHFDNNTISVLLGNGNGSFAAATSFAAGSGPRAFAVGDFNGDGFDDLLIAKSFDKKLTLLRGNGNGTFLPPVNYTISHTPTDIVVGDFNNDGKLDVAAADFYTDRVYVQLGNGDGTFQAAVANSVAAGPSHLAVGDFNGDGKLDLVSANFLASNVSVLRGTGSGTFQAAVNFAAGSGATFVAVVDLNRDGKLDLTVANANADNLTVLVGNGAGSFSFDANYAVGASPRSIAAALLNGDAYPDLVVTNQGADTVSVLLAIPPSGGGPVANAGGPYSVGEGGTVVLNGSGSTGTSLTYAWDLDGDGIFGETGTAATRGNETGATPTFLASGLDGPGVRLVSLRVTDSGGQNSTATATINITNVAPTLTISGNSSVNEGSTYTLNLASSDPGPDTIIRWTINWGDGQTQVYNGDPSSVTKVYADNGSYTITATATDEDGTWNANSKSLTVNNVAPTLIISGNNSVNEGSTYTLNLSATDPGNDTIIRWTINWGDGQTQVINGNPSSVTKVYADNGSYTITATATDEDGTWNANSKNLTVNNVAPTLIISGPGSVAAGSPYLLGLSSSDPGDDTIIRWVIDWGDGNIETVNGNPSSASHTYAQAGVTHTITATATDEDGTWSANSLSVSVVASGTAIADAGGPYTVNEGGTIVLNGAGSSGSGLTYAWDLDGDGIFGETGADATRGDETGANPTFLAEGLDGPGSSIVWLRVTDSGNNTSTDSATVNLLNVAPTLTISGPTTASTGTPYVLSLSSSDPGNDTIVQWVINWGDGVIETISGNPSSATHTYSAAGTRTISATATDEDGTWSANSLIVSVATLDTTHPTAKLTAGNITVGGGTTYRFTVLYQDNVAINLSFLDDNDILVTGPNGYSQFARFISVTAGPNNTYVATYQIAAPGGTWDWMDNGTYTVALQRGQVRDTTGNSVRHGTLGTFLCAVVPPDLAGNSLATALDLGTMSPGRIKAVDEWVGSVDRNDFYRFTVTSPVTLNVKLSNLTQNADLMLLDSAGNRILYLKRGSTNVEAFTRSMTPGTYYLRVLFADSVGTNYRLRLEAVGVSNPGPGPSDDNSMETARDAGTISPGTLRAFDAYIGPDDRNDFYRITITQPTRLYAKLMNMSDNADLMLLDSAGNRIAYSKRGGSSDEYFQLDLAPGTYFVRVLFAGTLGTTYRLRLEGLSN